MYLVWQILLKELYALILFSFLIMRFSRIHLLFCVNTYIDHYEDLRRLDALLWDGGGDALNRFLEIAQSDEPFPL